MSADVARTDSRSPSLRRASPLSLCHHVTSSRMITGSASPFSANHSEASTSLRKDYVGRTDYGAISSSVGAVRLTIADSADSMGYAFTYPLVRLVAGPSVAIGTYVHYPTVSADMVKRVRERSAGVESGGISQNWLRSRLKLGWVRWTPI